MVLNFIFHEKKLSEICNMDFKEIIAKLKDLMEPTFFFLAGFFITFLINNGIFIAIRFDGYNTLMFGTWATGFEDANLALSAGGWITVIILIAALAVGFYFWYLRKFAHMEKQWLSPYIDYPLMALGGILLEILLFGACLKLVW